MDLTLIVPKWPAGSLWGKVVFRFPYLSLTTLAAVTPADVRLRIVDENVEEIDWQATPDLVGISMMTPLAPRGYQIADAFRERGVPVVLGGVHPSVMPEEAENHGDAVVIGEGEELWPQVVRDAREGRLQPRYRDEQFRGLEGLPLPRRELLRRKAYFFVNTMQTSRGCPFDCEFCFVTQFHGRSYRLRPLAEVEREVQGLEGRFVFFVDDNIVGDRSYARALFQRLAPYRLRWASQATISIGQDEELLKLAKKSGCLGLFIGFESLSQSTLCEMGKNPNRADSYRELIRRIHSHGIGIQGSFVFGNDRDTPQVFSDVVRFTERMRLEAGLFSILTPFPGTRLYQRLKAEGRILSEDWARYDMNQVVFQPRGMTTEQLQQGFNWAYRRLYSWASITRRLLGLRRNLQLFAPQNVGFRRAWYQLLRQENPSG
jgi:radical SAM superfamily enzyme YgiQ (UPF0313 family)